MVKFSVNKQAHFCLPEIGGDAAMLDSGPFLKWRKAKQRRCH